MVVDGRLPAAHGVGDLARRHQRLAGRSQLCGGPDGIAEVGQHAAALEPPRGIGRVDRRVRERRLGRPRRVSTAQPLLEEGLQLHARVRRQSLLGRELRHAQQRGVIVRVNLDDLLVEPRGLGDEALAGEVLGNPRVLSDRLVDLAGPDVQVTQEVHRRPVLRLFLDQARVLHDGRIEATLPQQFLGSPQGLVAVHGFE